MQITVWVYGLSNTHGSRTNGCIKTKVSQGKFGNITTTHQERKRSNTMKKIMTAVAAFSMIAASASMASAMDSIDFMGKTQVTIATPAKQVAIVNTPKVVFDSNGAFTAMVLTDAAPVAANAGVKDDARFCLDSYCRTNIKM